MSEETLRIEGLADDREAVYPEAGVNHDFVVESSEIVDGQNDDGGKYRAWKVAFKKVGEGSEKYQAIRVSNFFPSAKDDAEQAARNRRAIKRMATLLGVPLDAFAGDSVAEAVQVAVGKNVNLKATSYTKTKGKSAGKTFHDVEVPKFE